jgi:uncharacterized protein (TIGR01244 family)
MSDFRAVTERFAVSPQISVGDVAKAVDAGFTLLINNRPDGEAPDQPLAAEIEAAAHGAGLAYMNLPIAGRPTADQIAAMGEAVDGASGKVLAFCRSGTRSLTTWALAQVHTGAVSPREIVALGANAGYDLSSLV